MSKGKRNASMQTDLSQRFRESLVLLDQQPSTVYRAIGYSTPSTIYSIIAGRCLPDLTKLIALSKITSPGGYRINLDWLITGVGSKTIKTGRTSAKREKLEKLLSTISQDQLNSIVILMGK